MAVDPFQRVMFNGLRGPGPDPRLQSGIMGANQAPQTPPVAAQPLRVASLSPALGRSTPGQVPSVPTPQPVQLAAPEIDYQAEYDSIVAQLETAEAEGQPQETIDRLSELLTDTVMAAREAAAPLREAAAPLREAAEQTRDELAVSIDEIDLKALKDQSDVQAIAQEDSPEPTPPPPILDAKRTDAMEAVKSVQDADKSLQAQLKLANLGNPVDLDAYQAQAKKLLGVDEDEADVPDWAAPMFLFGLNLMKGPVSSKVQGQTGLGGLLSDIGAAGEKGFAFFAAERSRKRKEKAAIAQVALDLKKMDTAKRTAALKSLVESRRWWADYLLKRGKEERLIGTEARIAADADRDFFAQQHERLANRLLGKDPDVDDTTNFYVALSKEEGRILGPPVEKGGGARGLRRLYDNPARMMLLGSIAAKRAGLAPEFKTETIPFGAGAELSYSTNGLKNYARKNNMEEGQVLSQIVDDPQNPKWAGIALAVNLGKNQIKYDPRTAQGVVTPTWIDIGLQEKELAAARNEKRAVNPSAFTTTSTPYLESNQEMKRISLGTFGGEEKFAYINLPKLALINAQRRKDGKPEIDLMDALKNPRKAPGVVSPQYSDTSGALNNLSTVELNVGATTTQDYLFNKNVLDTKRKEIAEKLGIEVSEVPSIMTSGEKIPWETLVDVGVLTPLGKPRDHKKPVTKTIMGRNGDWMVVEGSVGDIAGMESAANQQKLSDKVVSLAKANRAAYIIDNVYATMPTTRDGALISSKWTDWLSSASVAGKLVGLGKNALNRDLGRIRDFETVPGGPGREATNKLINDWSLNFDKWASSTGVDATNRQKLKSLFIGMAFDLASSREGGKLTDNDVDWAFKTLGFNTEAYLQNPAVVMTGLKTAIGQASMGLEMELMTIHEDAQAIREHNKDPENANNQRYLLEEVLASRWSGVNPGQVQPFHTTSEGKRVYRFDQSPHVFERRRSQTGGNAPVLPEQPGGGGERPTQPPTLSGQEKTFLGILDAKKVPRTLGDVRNWFEKLPSDSPLRPQYAPLIKSLFKKRIFE